MVKDAAPIGTHDHRAAQSDPARIRRIGGEKRAFPTGGDVDTESPLPRRIWFASAELPCSFIHGAIQSVTINGRGARVQPQTRRTGSVRNGLPDQTCTDRS